MVELALSGMAARGGARLPAAIAPAAAQPVSALPLSVSIISGPAAFEHLAADWQRLAGLQCDPVLFQMPGVLKAWSRHFADGDAGSLRTLVVRRNGGCVMIWPLRIETRALVRIARGAGAPIGQYDEILLDPDCDADEIMAAALDALRSEVRPDVIMLERVRDDGALRAALRDVTPFSATEAAPYSDLSGGMTALLKSLKSRVTRQQKKRVRRFDEEGRVAFEVAGGPAEAEAWLAEAMALKRQWLRDTGRLSRAFVRTETGECLAALARTPSGPDAAPRMVVARLTLDGRPAAIEMGFCHCGVYHLYLGAFAPDFARFGPGNILTERVLGWCAANGIARYDMLAPRSRNKAEWQSGEVLVFDFALPMTARGRLYVAAILRRLAPALRNAFYALPPPVRSAVAGMTLRM